MFSFAAWDGATGTAGGRGRARENGTDPVPAPVPVPAQTQLGSVQPCQVFLLGSYPGLFLAQSLGRTSQADSERGYFVSHTEYSYIRSTP